MTNTKKFAIAAAVAGSLMLVMPLFAGAQTGEQARPKNIEANRDYRNVVMMKRAISTSTRPIMQRMMGPAWLLAVSSTSPVRKIDVETMMRLRTASSTRLDGHEGWKKARLDQFAEMHGRLISEVTKSLDTLKQLRARIADRIQTATASGRDMGDAIKLLVVADAKITAADTALQTLVTMNPTILASATSTKIDESSEVNLEKPRAVGQAAIEAVKEVKKALSEVVTAIAHSMGNKNGTASTTQQ